MKFLFNILLLNLTCLYGFAQVPPIFELNENIIIIEDGDTLKDPFFGGLNNPQFNDVDLNNDGIKDLVIFEKANDEIYTFLNSGISDSVSYEYAPYYRNLFPTDITEWMLLTDYNQDGIEDIFAYTNSGIKVYKASYFNNEIQFALIADKLYYTGNSGNPVNVYASSIDIPAIVDVNFDGDLDVLNFNSTGSIIKYYENQSVENGYPFDSLYFEKLNECWGDFAENSTSSSIILNAYCQPGPDQEIEEGQNGLHAGSTILALDYDYDEDIDLIVGDVSSKSLVLLINGGDNNLAHIDTFFLDFPTNTQGVDVYIYPAAFLLDLNNDGIEDLVAAPNETYIFENYNQISFFEGINNPSQYEFDFVKTDFLVGEMIDVGETAAPCIIDFDGDGKKDLLIGNYGYFDLSDTTFNNTLTAYRNIGDSTDLVFELYDRDFNGLSQYGSFFGVYPAFEDLDSDGDLDMIACTLDGKVNYFKNAAGPNALMDLQLSIPNLGNINIGGGTSQPFSCFYDYNDDGKKDLVIGERAGKLNLFENTSVGSVINFQLIDAFWGGVNVIVPPLPFGYAAPYIGALDSTGKEYLLVHNLAGTITVYTDLDQANFTKLDSLYSDVFTGGLGAICVGDINDDRYLDLFAGNKRGGLQFYSQNIPYRDEDSVVISIPVLENSFKIYPNPILQNKTMVVKFTEPLNGTISILNIKGQRIVKDRINNVSKYEYNTKDLKEGMYFLHIESEGRIKTDKIIVN